MKKKREAVLGISAFGHDTAASLIDKKTGEVLYAVAEERLTNVKHDSRFPHGGINQCLEEAQRLGAVLTDVALNANPIEFIQNTLPSEIHRLVSDGVAAAKLVDTLNNAFMLNDYYQNGSVSKTVIDAEIERLDCDAATRDELQRRIAFYFNRGVKWNHLYHSICDMFPEQKVHKICHHLSHAASAFFNSGFKKSTVMVVDGQGESETASIYLGDEDGLKKVAGSVWPHSLGIFYLFATRHLGFDLGDEYKVMGMAAYGQPKYYDTLSEMVDVSDAVELCFHETACLSIQEMPPFGHIVYAFTEKLSDVVPSRSATDDILQCHFDFAASIQKLTEDIGVEIARKAMALTGEKNISIAGGVGLNGLMNEQIRRRSGCSDIFIYPAAGDDGGAIGAAQLVAFKHAKFFRPRMTTCYYGYDPTDQEIEAVLKSQGLIFSKPESISRTVAESLADNKIIARYNSRAEFGPRALGHRSILANATDPSSKDILNVRIKHREPFRPFAPVCLRENLEDFFELDVDSPFMLLICKSKERAKSEVPAVVHDDGTARVQTIDKKQNLDLYHIISEFKKITGTPVIINTSFNVNGETIVDTPLDAVESFGFMDIDFLAIGDYWVSKKENAHKFPEMTQDEYLQIRQQRFLEKYAGSMSVLDIDYYNHAIFSAKVENKRSFSSRVKNKLKRAVSSE